MKFKEYDSFQKEYENRKFGYRSVFDRFYQGIHDQKEEKINPKNTIGFFARAYINLCQE